MAIYSNRIVISISKAGVGPWLRITNSQSIPAQAGLQVMWQVPVSTLQARFAQLNINLNSNLSNLRFVYNSQFVPAWLESINNGIATIWIKMPVSIPANSSITLNLYSNSTLNFDGVYWGEAPQLSPTYGQYDNGTAVFNNYWNFAGTSLPSGWTWSPSTIYYTVNNGLTITCPSGIAYYVISPLSLGMNSNLIWSAYFYNLPSFSSGNYEIGFGIKQVPAPYYFAGLSSYQSTTGLGSFYFIGTAYKNYTTTWSNNGVYSALWQNNYIYTSFNESAFTNQLTTSITFSSSLTIYEFNHASSGSFNFSVGYVYLRSYPPNGIMPTVELM